MTRVSTPSPSSFVLYEPVTVQCRLANLTPGVIRTLRLFSPDMERIRFSITQPDGTIQEHRHLGIDDAIRLEVLQEPGSIQPVEVNLHRNAAANDWTFPTPGSQAR